MKLAGITVIDGQPTEAGLDLCKLVYEKVTGKCWHNNKGTHDSQGVFMPYGCCSKCKFTITIMIGPEVRIAVTDNPALLTDLNAIHELEDDLLLSQHKPYWKTLEHIRKGAYTLPDAYECLQALAMSLEAECEGCNRHGEQDTSGYGDIVNCKGCNGTGKTTVFDSWTRKWDHEK